MGVKMRVGNPDVEKFQFSDEFIRLKENDQNHLVCSDVRLVAQDVKDKYGGKSQFTCANQTLLVHSRSTIFDFQNAAISRFYVVNVVLSSSAQALLWSMIQTHFTIESLHFTAPLKWLAGPHCKASKSQLNLIIQNYQSPAKIRSEWEEESGQPGRTWKRCEVFLIQRLRQNQEGFGSMRVQSEIDPLV